MYNWLNSINVYKDPRVIRLLFLGFSSGLPILLIFSTLSLWLKSAGIDRGTITLFSLAGLSYGFKFLWAPLIDRVSISLLSKYFGHRRSWLGLIQILLISSFFLTGLIDPAENLTTMCLVIISIGFLSATQDIIIDAYRIESAPIKMQPALSSSYIIGYRVGMIVAGAGSLLIASYLGGDSEQYDASSWQLTYIFMGCLQIIGLLTCVFLPEPMVKRQLIKGKSDSIRLFLSFLISMTFFGITFTFFPDNLLEDPLIKALFGLTKIVLSLLSSLFIVFVLIKIKFVKFNIVKSTFYEPIENFIINYGKFAVAIIIIIGIYRIADIVMGVVANLFYADKGYTLSQIASYSKFWGLLATIAGGLIGGVLSFRYGFYIVLLIGAVLSSSSNLLFAFLANIDPQPFFLMLVITADNLSGGIASVAFVAFLSSITNRDFTASQFALFTSIMVFAPKIIGGYSGTLVNEIGYSYFFIFTAVLGVPVILLILFLKKHLYNKV